MAGANDREITGAWIIHHGRKLALDTNGSSEYPAIDEAAKAATLLTKLGETNEAKVTLNEARAIATASGMNPRYELNSLLDVLKSRKLLETAGEEIVLLGVTTRSSLSHASDIFKDAEPSKYELASIALAEIASEAPVKQNQAQEKISDEHHLSSTESSDFFRRAEEIGFVDTEGSGVDKLLFNGNLFRRDNVAKSARVLESLHSPEQALVREVSGMLSARGCLTFEEVEKVLSPALFEKLVAAGVYDLNRVDNEQGAHVFVTSPSAFHKFADPMVDDSFDMAKALVAALSYGMTERASTKGRIDDLPVLLGKLIKGWEVGPATAIGEDYRVLEVNRVVQLRPDLRYPDRFHLKLLKREIGELALQVLTHGNATGTVVKGMISAPMAGYVGPEESRNGVRKRQSIPSKKTTHNILDAVRGGRTFR